MERARRVDRRADPEPPTKIGSEFSGMTRGMSEPAVSSHRILLTAAPADIDELDHVSNLVYLRWVQEVAMAHSVAVGWDHPQYRDLGAIFVVRRHEIDYVTPVLLGEEVELHTWIGWWKLASSERRTSIRRVRDGKEVARAATLWAFIELATGRPRRIPEEVRRAFGLSAADVPS
jgi:acyl-CoA thioester hydrolase